MNSASTPLKVLHALGRMEPGGAEVRLVELIGRIGPGEFRIDVCALSGLPGSLDPAVTAGGGSVIPLALNLRFPRRFVRLLKDNRYDIVHAHVLYSSGLILALAAWVGVPVRIAHFRATQDIKHPTLARRVQKGVMRWLVDRYATHIVGCGEGAINAMWGAGWRDDSRCRVLFDTVDPARFEHPVDRNDVRAEIGVPAAASLYVHVGNEVAEKNHYRLIEMFAAILKVSPESWLILAGANTDHPNGTTARAVAELGVGNRVVALGLRDDVPRLLKAADALLLPSLAEGLPGVVLEACAAGVPVLASDIPGVREIADRLALVRYLPLSASDGDWAQAAVGLAAEAQRIRLKETAAEAFRGSVFHIERGVEAHRALWRGLAEPAPIRP